MSMEQRAFEKALVEALARADFRFVGSQVGRTEGGGRYHEVTGSSVKEGISTYRIVVPPDMSPWDIRVAEQAEGLFLYGYLHYCAATAFCPGGRNDTGDWKRVDCPDCLKSHPFNRPVGEIIAEGSKSMGEVWAGVAEHAAQVERDLRATWYSFECHNGDCRSKEVGDRTGCVLDVRIPLRESEPMIPCPWCQSPMDFRGLWAADQAGYGARSSPPIILGIAGGTASGKSVLAQALVESLGERAVHILHDRYYRTVPREVAEHPNRVLLYNYDHPAALETDLLINHLHALKSGTSVGIPHYDFATSSRTDDWKVIDPRPIIVVEGILILAVHELRQMFDHTVFVDTPDDIRLARRFKRDTVARGQRPEEVIAQYEQTVRPMHEQFVKPSAALAQLRVDGQTPVERLVEEVTTFFGLGTTR